MSQTVGPILSKIRDSEFIDESHQETRRKAYHRSHRGFWEASHDLRICECDYCSQYRKAFRTAIQSVLTRREIELLDVCDRMEPQIAPFLKRHPGL